MKRCALVAAAISTVTFVGQVNSQVLSATGRTSVPRVVLVDALGKTMGPFFPQPPSTPQAYGSVFMMLGSYLVQLPLLGIRVNPGTPDQWVDPTRLVAPQTETYVYFSDNNCMGTPMLRSSGGADGPGGSVSTLTMGDGIGKATVYIAPPAKPEIRAYASVLVIGFVCNTAPPGSSQLTTLVNQVVDLSTVYSAPYTVKLLPR